jgi:adenylylsulfate kinase
MHHFFESNGRSILKTITWKIIATSISFCVTYYESGNVAYAFKVSSIVLVIGLIAYYLHERLWNGIHWGKVHVEHN